MEEKEKRTQEAGQGEGSGEGPEGYWSIFDCRSVAEYGEFENNTATQKHKPDAH